MLRTNFLSEELQVPSVTIAPEACSKSAISTSEVLKRIRRSVVKRLCVVDVDPKYVAILSKDRTNRQWPNSDNAGVLCHLVSSLGLKGAT